MNARRKALGLLTLMGIVVNCGSTLEQWNAVQSRIKKLHNEASKEPWKAIKGTSSTS